MNLKENECERHGKESVKVSSGLNCQRTGCTEILLRKGPLTIPLHINKEYLNQLTIRFSQKMQCGLSS
jgi:hypothetical protein